MRRMQSSARLRWPVLFLVFRLIVASAAAQSDLTVYSNSLSNGFEDRWWMSHDVMNTSPVHSGPYSISVSVTNAWQGLYLHRGDLDTTPFVSLSFWINGGTNGGQRLQVQAMLGNSNPPPDVYYRFATLTDAWQQITIPLAALGVNDKTNLTGFWIQLTPAGSTNAFYVDDIQFNAKPVVLAPAANTNLMVAAAPQQTGVYWNFAAWCVAGALVLITALLSWLIVMLRRSGLGTSRALLPSAAPDPPLLALSTDTVTDMIAEARPRPSETPVDPQSQALREKIASELAEFARQSLVQGIYAQRAKLAGAQQKAQAELAELEARLASLHLPLQQRIRVYEARISELEKKLETRDEEMRNMILATLELIRERLEREKAGEPGPSRFN
jgi:hypothetical protein